MDSVITSARAIFRDVSNIPNRLTLPSHISAIRFDCGSGVGTVRSTETVKLNEWNTLSVYRHRWDAWIQLNQEKRVEGRSKVRALHFISIKARRRILFTRVYRGFKEGIDIPQHGGTVLSGLPVSLFEFSRFLRWRPHVHTFARPSPSGLAVRVLRNNRMRKRDSIDCDNSNSLSLGGGK